jgi:hypothetical protein
MKNSQKTQYLIKPHSPVFNRINMIFIVVIVIKNDNDCNNYTKTISSLFFNQNYRISKYYSKDDVYCNKNDTF